MRQNTENVHYNKFVNKQQELNVMAVIHIIVCLFVFLVGVYNLFAGYRKLEAANALKEDLDEAEFSKEIFRFEVLGFLRVITGLIFIVFAHAFI